MNISSLYLYKKNSMSPRPRKSRNIGRPPSVLGFYPTGKTGKVKSDPVVILFEEWEALKLVDYDHLSQLEAAREMGISRPTLTRIYDQVRKKLALAFVEGREIRIEGGFVDFTKEWYRCRQCHAVFQLEPEEEKKCPECGSKDIYNLNESVRDWQNMRRRGRWRGETAGFCVCPSCGTRVKHEFGRPCNTYVCPNCGQPMIRE